MTARPAPIIALTHTGFVPNAPKVLVVRATGANPPSEFTLADVAAPFSKVLPLKKYAGDLGKCLTGDCSEIERPGMYQITAGGEKCVPFFIGPEVWRRTLPKAVSYIHAQRCGTEVPNIHPACHLDDGRRRDTGEHIDATGGWHDAGDLRKWMSATMLNGFALLNVVRTLGETWDRAGTGVAPLLAEFRWGNTYFLKMQDTDGQLWADTAGGVNGDNSDNHWTDNRIGTADDRYINPAKDASIQAEFVALEATAAQLFRQADAEYAGNCLEAGARCWDGSRRGDSASEVAWWTRAALEFHLATGKPVWESHAAALGRQLLALQNTAFAGSQKLVRGYWRMSQKDSRPYTDAVDSALPALVLLELAASLPGNPDAKRWKDAVKLYIEEYVLPMTARSAYRIMPFGLFSGSPTQELYRPLTGGLTYRYFMPVMKEFWWVGTTSHLAAHALLLARAHAAFGERGYRNLAYRQLEWILGANPFGACLMTGEGMRNPYPHSRFVGLIPGGIMNGIGGNEQDEPVLDTENGFDWRTTEYWSPHNYNYISAVAELERTA